MFFSQVFGWQACHAQQTELAELSQLLLEGAEKLIALQFSTAKACMNQARYTALQFNSALAD